MSLQNEIMRHFVIMFLNIQPLIANFWHGTAIDL